MQVRIDWALWWRLERVENVRERKLGVKAVARCKKSKDRKFSKSECCVMRPCSLREQEEQRVCFPIHRINSLQGRRLLRNSLIMCMNYPARTREIHFNPIVQRKREVSKWIHGWLLSTSNVPDQVTWKSKPCFEKSKSFEAVVPLRSIQSLEGRRRELPLPLGKGSRKLQGIYRIFLHWNGDIHQLMREHERSMSIGDWMRLSQDSWTRLQQHWKLLAPSFQWRLHNIFNLSLHSDYELNLRRKWRQELLPGDRTMLMQDYEAKNWWQEFELIWVQGLIRRSPLPKSKIAIFIIQDDSQPCSISSLPACMILINIPGS